MAYLSHPFIKNESDWSNRFVGTARYGIFSMGPGYLFAAGCGSSHEPLMFDLHALVLDDTRAGLLSALDGFIVLDA